MDVPASQTQEEIVDVPVPHKESVYAAVSDPGADCCGDRVQGATRGSCQDAFMCQMTEVRKKLCVVCVWKVRIFFSVAL